VTQYIFENKEISEFSEASNLIRKKLINSKKLIITTHINPDGDAIGSALGFYFYAKSMKVDAKIILPSAIASNLLYLEGCDECEVFDEAKHNELINSADDILIVDLNDLGRLHELGDSIAKSNACITVVDHHQEPKDFASNYLVDTEVSSTGELIFDILKTDENYTISKAAADALYCAVMTDTGSFRFPRTTSKVHRMIADLIDCGADHVRAYEEVYNQNSFAGLKLLGNAFAKLEQHYDSAFSLMTVRTDDFAKADATEDDIEGFVEKTLSVKGSKVGVLMIEVEERNEARCSFRSKYDYDVRQIAVGLGGGGHMNAAGARVAGRNFDELKAEIIRKVGEIM
jgi:bifunctional oligoribonuclease and PAP phosphatase NrnA